MTAWPLRGSHHNQVVHVLLITTLLGTYLAWLGWHRDVDPQAHQVLGAVATAALLTTAAAWSRPRPKRTANTAFWFLFLVNLIDMGLRPGPNFWLVSAAFFGPVVWLTLWLPAKTIDERRPQLPLPSPELAPRPAGPLDPDSQIAAWRASQLRHDRRSPG